MKESRHVGVSFGCHQLLAVSGSVLSWYAAGRLHGGMGAGVGIHADDERVGMIRTEEARALRWSEVDLEEGTVAVYRSVRARVTPRSPQEPPPPQAAQGGTRGAEGTPQAAGRRTAPGGHETAGPRPGLLPGGRHPAGPLAGPPRVRRHHPGRGPGGGVGTPGAAPLVRIYPQRPRRRIEDISDLVGHGGTSVTGSVYRHEIRPALTTGATATPRFPVSPDLAIPVIGANPSRGRSAARVAVGHHA